jgi:putative endonuclease
MYYIYVSFSESAGIYYVGYANDPERRLVEHNTNSHNTFTSKYRPWIMKALFECGLTVSQAILLERVIKKQNSRKLLELLCNSNFIPVGKLAQLVRAPHILLPFPFNQVPTEND